MKPRNERFRVMYHYDHMVMQVHYFVNIKGVMLPKPGSFGGLLSFLARSPALYLQGQRRE